MIFYEIIGYFLCNYEFEHIILIGHDFLIIFS